MIKKTDGTDNWSMLYKIIKDQDRNVTLMMKLTLANASEMLRVQKDNGAI